jgi:hypothetical protein
MRTNIVIASLAMIAITLALFFLPLVNGLIGGAVGGYLAGTWRRGLAASLVPAVAVAFGVWVLLLLFDAPVIGIAAALGVGVLILLADLGIVVGGALGGYFAESRRRTVHA